MVFLFFSDSNHGLSFQILTPGWPQPACIIFNACKLRAGQAVRVSFILFQLPFYLVDILLNVVGYLKICCIEGIWASDQRRSLRSILETTVVSNSSTTMKQECRYLIWSKIHNREQTRKGREKWSLFLAKEVSSVLVYRSVYSNNRQKKLFMRHLVLNLISHYFLTRLFNFQRPSSLAITK